MRIESIALAFCTAFFPVFSGYGGTPPSSPDSAGSGFLAEIELNDGTVIKGRLVRQDDSVVGIASPLLGNLTIAAADIRRLYQTRAGSDASRDIAVRAQTAVPAPAAGGPWERDPGDHSLMFMPTAFMQPPGSVYFKDYELLWLTFSCSPFSKASFTAGCLFPVTFDFQMLSVGGKFQVLSASSGSATAGFALTGSATAPLFADLLFWEIGSVLSYRPVSNRLGFHGAIGIRGSRRGHPDSIPFYGAIEDESRRLSYAAGLEGQVAKHGKIVVELFNNPRLPFFNGVELDFLGLGLRLFNNRLSTDIGGLAPLHHTMASRLILIPYLTISYRLR